MELGYFFEKACFFLGMDHLGGFRITTKGIILVERTKD